MSLLPVVERRESLTLSAANARLTVSFRSPDRASTAPTDRAVSEVVGAECASARAQTTVEGILALVALLFLWGLVLAPLWR